MRPTNATFTSNCTAASPRSVRPRRRTGRTGAPSPADVPSIAASHKRGGKKESTDLPLQWLLDIGAKAARSGEGARLHGAWSARRVRLACTQADYVRGSQE